MPTVKNHIILYEKLLEIFNSYLNKEELNYYQKNNIEFKINKIKAAYNLLINNPNLEKLYTLSSKQAKEINLINEWYIIMEATLNYIYDFLNPVPGNKKDYFEEYRKIKGIEKFQETPDFFEDLAFNFTNLSYEEIIKKMENIKKI